MEALNRGNNLASRYVCAEDLKQYTGLGKHTAVRIAKECGAEIAIGRRRVYDLHKVDSYMEKKAAG